MNIKEIITVINQMRADGIIGQYAIGGAVAATFYIDPSSTYDVDVFLILDPLPGQLMVTLEPIHRYLEAKGYSLNIEGYNVISDWAVQFIPASTPLTTEALLHSVEKDLDGVTVKVFSPEYLAALALELGRPKDKFRLSQFLEMPSFKKIVFSEILQKHDLFAKWDKFKRQEMS